MIKYLLGILFVCLLLFGCVNPFDNQTNSSNHLNFSGLETGVGTVTVNYVQVGNASLSESANLTQTIRGFVNVSDSSPGNASYNYSWFVNEFLVRNGSINLSSNGLINVDNLSYVLPYGSRIVLNVTVFKDGSNYDSGISNVTFVQYTEIPNARTKVKILDDIEWLHNSTVAYANCSVNAIPKDNASILSAYFTVTAPNGSVILNNLLGTRDPNNAEIYYSPSFAPSSLGQYTCYVNVLDSSFTSIIDSKYFNVSVGLPDCENFSKYCVLNGVVNLSSGLMYSHYVIDSTNATINLVGVGGSSFYLQAKRMNLGVINGQGSFYSPSVCNNAEIGKTLHLVDADDVNLNGSLNLDGGYCTSSSFPGTDYLCGNAGSLYLDNVDSVYSKGAITLDGYPYYSSGHAQDCRYSNGSTQAVRPAGNAGNVIQTGTKKIKFVNNGTISLVGGQSQQFYQGSGSFCFYDVASSGSFVLPYSYGFLNYKSINLNGGASGVYGGWSCFCTSPGNGGLFNVSSVDGFGLNDSFSLGWVHTLVGSFDSVFCPGNSYNGTGLSDGSNQSPYGLFCNGSQYGLGNFSPSITPDNVYTYSYCYQESATVSNQSGMDGVCNQNYSGAYSYSNSGDFYYGYIFINYSKPSNSSIISAIWQAKYGSTSTVNVTIPSDCWNAYPNSVNLWIRQSCQYPPGANGLFYRYCYNGTDWKTLESINVGYTGYGTSGPTTPASAYDGNWGTFAFWGGGAWYNSLGSGDCTTKVWEENLYWKVVASNVTQNATVTNGTCNALPVNYSLISPSVVNQSYLAPNNGIGTVLNTSNANGVFNYQYQYGNDSSPLGVYWNDFVVNSSDFSRSYPNQTGAYLVNHRLGNNASVYIRARAYNSSSTIYGDWVYSPRQIINYSLAVVFNQTFVNGTFGWQNYYFACNIIDSIQNSTLYGALAKLVVDNSTTYSAIYSPTTGDFRYGGNLANFNLTEGNHSFTCSGYRDDWANASTLPQTNFSVSPFGIKLPNNVYSVYFACALPTFNNVVPAGQTFNTAVFTIRNNANSTKNLTLRLSTANMSMFSNITIGAKAGIYTAGWVNWTVLTNASQIILPNVPSLNQTGVWLKANCSNALIQSGTNISYVFGDT